MASDLIDGGGEGPGNWDRFGGGILAKRRPCVYNPDGEKPQPDYSDRWSLATFGADPYNGPVGTQDARHRMGSLPPEIYEKHK